MDEDNFCECALIAKVERRALEKVLWRCLDCGNLYGPEVHECPNQLLDEQIARERRLGQYAPLEMR